MKIKIVRKRNEAHGCFGVMELEGFLEPFFTLEPKDRFLDQNGGKGKIDGMTAIPCGNYEGVFHTSPKFGECIWLQNVPWFSEILIHAGNTAKDTKGCILVGISSDILGVKNSKIALQKMLGFLRGKDSLRVEITRNYI
jgi:hypothetical protein